MSNKSSTELIHSLFMPCAFHVVTRQHHDIEDTDAYFLAWEMLWAASDMFNKALEIGDTESKALLKAFDVFINAYKSLES